MCTWKEREGKEDSLQQHKEIWKVALFLSLLPGSGGWLSKWGRVWAWGCRPQCPPPWCWPAWSPCTWGLDGALANFSQRQSTTYLRNLSAVSTFWMAWKRIRPRSRGWKVEISLRIVRSWRRVLSDETRMRVRIVGWKRQAGYWPAGRKWQ